MSNVVKTTLQRVFSFMQDSPAVGSTAQVQPVQEVSPEFNAHIASRDIAAELCAAMSDDIDEQIDAYPMMYDMVKAELTASRPAYSPAVVTAVEVEPAPQAPTLPTCTRSRTAEAERQVKVLVRSIAKAGRGGEANLLMRYLARKSNEFVARAYTEAVA